MNCQTFSIALSSGHLGGSGTRVTLGGTASLSDMCHPARSTSSTACAPGATAAAISARCRFIAAVWQWGSTDAAPLPSPGADGAEDVGRGGALVGGRGGPGAPSGPAAGDLVLPSDPGLILSAKSGGLGQGCEARHARSGARQPLQPA